MKVSVIISTYLISMLEHFIECVRSVMGQSYDDLEIICIVDGNEKYYEKIKKDYGDIIKDGNISIYLNEKNLGANVSANIGAKHSSGDIVAFIDDDAVADKDWLKEHVRMYEEYDAIAVGGKILPLWMVKKPGWLPEEFYWMIGATYLGFPEEMGEVRNVFGSNLSFKRDIFWKLGGFNPNIGGVRGKKMLQSTETELCDRMRREFGRGVLYNPKAIVYHKVFKNRTQLSFLSRRAFWQGYSKAMMEYFGGDIKEEKGFLTYLIRTRTPKRLKNIFKGSLNDFLKLIFIWYFASLVGVGYVWGKIRG